MSTTMRSVVRIARLTSVFQDVGKHLISHSARCGLGADTIHNALEFGIVNATNPLVLRRRHDHRNIAILAANQHRFALGSIEQRGEALFGIRGRDSSHLSIIDKIDKSRKQEGFLVQVTRVSCYTVFVSQANRLRNVTVTLEEDVAQWARIEAARRDTSRSRLLGERLKERLSAQEGYERAVRRALARKPSLGS